MRTEVKTYIYGVIGAGALTLVYSLAHIPAVNPGAWALFVALTVLASVIKLRLPGMEATYSPNFLLLLYGVAHLSPAETSIAACAGAIAQSLLNTKKRPSAVQVLFNMANLTLSIAVCSAIARVWLTAGTAHYLPAVMALAACVYFVVNTVLVAGVLSLLHGKPLGEVCREWYLWSLPYYLVGVVVVGMIPAPGYAGSAEGLLVLIPLLYLIHFFAGLRARRGASESIGERADEQLPRAARWFVAATVGVCALVLIRSVFVWDSQNMARFAVYLGLGILASTFKISLPGLRGTITPAFVVMLAAIAQMSFGETAVMAAILGLVQVLWRPAKSPRAAQVLFNPACLALSCAVAWYLSRSALEPWLGESIAATVVVAALAQYLSNTLMVAVVLALASGKPLSGALQLCCFWSLPYYLVGAAAAGLMTAVSRVADWPPSLLVLPLVALLYVSYRAQLGRADNQLATASS